MLIIPRDQRQREINAEGLKKIMILQNGGRDLTPEQLEQIERVRKGDGNQVEIEPPPLAITLVMPQLTTGGNGKIIPVHHVLGGNGNGTTGSKEIIEGLVKKAQRDEASAPPTNISITCPVPGCGGTITERNGRNGAFFGCGNYRKGCKWTAPVTPKDFIERAKGLSAQQVLSLIIEKEDLTCPKCQKTLLIRVSKKGDYSHLYLKCGDCGFYKPVSKLNGPPLPKKEPEERPKAPTPIEIKKRSSKKEFLGICAVCKAPVRRRRGRKPALECSNPKCETYRCGRTTLSPEKDILMTCPDCGSMLVREDIYLVGFDREVFSCRCEKFDLYNENGCNRAVFWRPGTMPEVNLYSFGWNEEDIQTLWKYLVHLGGAATLPKT